MSLVTDKIVGANTLLCPFPQACLLLLYSLSTAITGASRGIGRATALEFAKHGASGLILHYLGDEVTKAEIASLEDEVHGLNTSCKTIAVGGDIAVRGTSLQIVAEGVKAFGRIGENYAS